MEFIEIELIKEFLTDEEIKEIESIELIYRDAPSNIHFINGEE